ncbi:related to Vacuolar amino acid transporter 7 [Saccharomycodes ludwigii]|uniref:Related to Vacuolar amino acid transporter 7 n=1 Tax=Saccharomycodes ludwigii TaxID=36035 RepID=A0A376B8L0_9ASCO|nr:hypothetical protein SCDLUD_002744 [Saccharomycodes ludwigii]KAH3901255.1 hypothetical protein SCDLUD_002744 [Saccharomycodes ludwigii]SSD61018.1 related to Vacuolar amino acid transporter 7 [Saccharomycodes ludwigii]
MSASITSSTINLTKTIVGAGLLAIPYAFNQDGILIGSLLTILAAITTSYGLYLLGISSSTFLSDPRSSSFFSLCAITYPNFTLLFDFAMFVQCYGVCLSYIVLIGDVFPSLFGGDRSIWIYLSTLLVVPLSLLKNLDSLRYSSLVGLCAIAYLVCFIVTKFFTDGITSTDAIHWITVNSFKGLFSSFSILVFAYTASMNMFSICNELQDNSIKNITRVINQSVGISCTLFLTVGILGYLTFGDDVQGNIIINYDPNSIFTKIGQFSLGITIIFSFPLLFHPLRISTNNMVFSIIRIYNNNGKKYNETNHTAPLLNNSSNNNTTATYSSISRISSSQASHTSINSMIDESSLLEEAADLNTVEFSNSRFYLITFILLVSIYLLGLNVTSFALVLSLVGATGSTSISFILPGLFGYKLFSGNESTNKRNSNKLIAITSLVLTIYGVSVMIISVFATLFLQ